MYFNNNTFNIIRNLNLYHFELKQFKTSYYSTRNPIANESLFTIPLWA